MGPPAQRLCEGCVLDWKWFSETVPEARLRLPRGNLPVLSLQVSPATHNDSTHIMKKQLDLATSEYLCLSLGQDMAVICLTVKDRLSTDCTYK